MASVADAIARFVDLSVPLDIAVFDQLVAVAYTPGNPQQAEAQAAIMALPEHPGLKFFFAVNLPKDCCWCGHFVCVLFPF